MVNIGWSPRNCPSGQLSNKRPSRRNASKAEAYAGEYADEEEAAGGGGVLAAFLVACAVAIWLVAWAVSASKLCLRCLTGPAERAESNGATNLQRFSNLCDRVAGMPKLIALATRRPLDRRPCGEFRP